MGVRVSRALPILAMRDGRALASEASPVIISAPDIGYRHACHATDEQLMAAENSLRSQAAKMMARATKIADMRRNRVQPLLAL